jgi:DNA-binding XRE family transcriptional regulator
MSDGYSNRLVQLNNKADQSLLGVRLGRVCIEHDVPVSTVASELGVSRQTVYNWFCGVSTPRVRWTVQEFIDSYAAD